MTEAQSNINSAYNAWQGGYITNDEYAANVVLNGGTPVPNPTPTPAGNTGVDFGPNEGADWLRTGSGLSFEEFWGVGSYGTPLLKSTANINNYEQSPGYGTFSSKNSNNAELNSVGCSGGLVLSSSATATQIHAYERALAYLRTSELASILIENLMYTEVPITIVFVDKLESWYNHETRTIYWDPTAGMLIGDKVMSPAMSLLHEMGHAAQQFEGWFDGSWNRWVVENDVLARFETPVANELGEYTRSNYLSARNGYRVSSSTNWGYVVTVHPWWHDSSLWNCVDSCTILVNLNTWSGYLTG